MTRGNVKYPQTFGVRLTLDQAEKLRAIAAIDDRPPTALARRMIVEALERYSPENREGSAT